jgi:MFS superfamily sulfate permease-like transporter
VRIAGNEYSVREAAGALGDLGTLIPFLAGYITVSGMDPVGVLLAFGGYGIATGLYFRTPVPVQPMKAIGTAAISHPGVVSPGAIWVSGLFTGLLWLAMGLSGAAGRIARLTTRPVVTGLVLGLGLGFVREGVALMQGDGVLAVAAVAMTFALLSRPRVPATAALLGLGALVALARDPGLLGALGRVSLSPRMPAWPAGGLAWEAVTTGVLVLGLPQAALTLGNAVVATVETNNALFPERRTSVKAVAINHGLMNLVGAGLGGVPMCHGAGGMAGHVRFGARTGGATVMLGLALALAGLLAGDSVAAFFGLIPPAVLGVLLFFAGLELAAGLGIGDLDRAGRYVMLTTAGVAMWNMGAGYLAGLLLALAFDRRWLTP